MSEQPPRFQLDTPRAPTPLELEAVEAALAHGCGGPDDGPAYVIATLLYDGGHTDRGVANLTGFAMGYLYRASLERKAEPR